MALLGMEGFDIYGADDIEDWWEDDGSTATQGTIVPTGGRCGDPCLRNNTTGQGPLKGVNPATQEGYAGWAQKISFQASHQQLRITYGAADNAHLHFSVSSLGQLRIYNMGIAGVSTLLVAESAAGLVQNDTWNHYGAEWKIHLTDGYARFYLNGALILNFTGRTVTQLYPTFVSPIPDWNSLEWNPHGYIDDMYWGDASGPAPWNAFMGDLRVEGQLALTDDDGGGGTHREFTPSAGTDHGALLGENPPDDDTSYVESATVGHRESVKFPPIVLSSGTVYGVQMMVNARKATSGGGSRSLAPTIEHGGSFYSGTAYSLPDEFVYIIPGQNIWQTNPGTGVTWTASEVNNSEGGAIITA